MRPSEIYLVIEHYSGRKPTTICRLHSACAPDKKRNFACGCEKSTYPVIDFDKVKDQHDRYSGKAVRKSVDALAVTPSESYLCFIELKSWQMLLDNYGTEAKVKQQAKGYETSLPKKLTDSIEICKEITGDPESMTDCDILYALVTDISIEEDGFKTFVSDMTELMETPFNLSQLCNNLSRKIMQNIPDIQTRYWECRNFDTSISNL